jgi:predicted DNA-binding transcriptional regulator YafY
MKTKTQKFENLLKIFSLLGAEKTLTAARLSKALEVSERTVFRYIAEINRAFKPLPVVKGGQEGFYLVKTDILDILKSKDDYLTGAAVLGSSFSAAFRKKPAYPETLKKRVRQRIQAFHHIPEPLLSPLLLGLFDEKPVKITYNSGNRTGKVNILPMMIVTATGIPYLIAYDIDKDGMKTYGITKIATAVRADCYVPVKKIDEARKHLESAWGIMTGGETTEVIFEAGEDILPYFTASPLHSSQRIERRGGAGRVSLPVHNISEFIRWSLRFGKSIRIIGPEKVREEALRFLREMEEFYGA